MATRRDIPCRALRVSGTVLAMGRSASRRVVTASARPSSHGWDRGPRWPPPGRRPRLPAPAGSHGWDRGPRWPHRCTAAASRAAAAVPCVVPPTDMSTDDRWLRGTVIGLQHGADGIKCEGSRGRLRRLAVQTACGNVLGKPAAPAVLPTACAPPTGVNSAPGCRRISRCLEGISTRRGPPSPPHTL